jgi:diguanylate cyclase (GGDEF)-like protein
MNKKTKSVLISKNLFTETNITQTDTISFSAVVYETLEVAVEKASNQSIQIVVLDNSLSDYDIETYISQLKEKGQSDPVYLFYTLDNDSSLADYQKYLEMGIDDILVRPVSIEALEIRVYVAAKMLKAREELVKEREFFRKAVKQEEELSSKVLDQNLSLKKAYQDIEILNQKLAKANEELERLARYDNLSGLLNRLNLFSIMDVEIERALRSEIPLCGIMMDIDYFKKINDTYGHPCGDIVIREIGFRLRKDLRKYDYAGRYGGEEFFIVLPNTTLDEAKQIAERFRKKLCTLPIHCESQELKVTASLGVAKFRHGESREEWLSRADKAMYMAKETGRNRVEVE